MSNGWRHLSSHTDHESFLQSGPRKFSRICGWRHLSSHTDEIYRNHLHTHIRRGGKPKVALFCNRVKFEPTIADDVHP
jgi:hypothetical protein